MKTRDIAFRFLRASQLNQYIALLTSLILLSACQILPSRSLQTSEYVYRDYIEVEIQGEVDQPGVYELPKKATLELLIERAGGVKETGDISYLNLHQRLGHEDVIVIDRFREQVRISINTAPVEELVKIPGIGPKTAQAIVDYRETTGLFQSVGELDHVKGIGQKKLEKLRDFVRL